MPGRTNADVHTAPAVMIIIGVAGIVGGIAMARWWRAVARLWRRSYEAMGMNAEDFFGPEGKPHGLGVGLIFFCAVLLPIGGLIFLVTGISRL